MTARTLYGDDEVGAPTSITTSWDPVAGDVEALELGKARFLRTDEASFSLSFDAAVLGAEAVIVAIERVSTTGSAVISSIVRGSNVPAAFPESGGNIRLRDGRMIFALLDIGPSSPTSAEFTINFSGSGNVVFDIRRIVPVLQWVMPEGMDADWTVGYIDTSDIRESDSRHRFASRREVLRELVVQFRARDQEKIILPADSAGLMRILRKVGRSLPVMMIPRDQGAELDAEIAVAGHIRDDSEITHVSGPTFNSGQIRIREFA